MEKRLAVVPQASSSIVSAKSLVCSLSFYTRTALSGNVCFSGDDATSSHYNNSYYYTPAGTIILRECLLITLLQNVVDNIRAHSAH